MANIIWSPRAISDLEEIFNFVAKDSEFYARLLAKNIIGSAEILCKYRLSGRIVPEFNREELREKIYKNYRIVYRTTKNRVEIVAVVHSARLMPDL